MPTKYALQINLFVGKSHITMHSSLLTPREFDFPKYMSEEAQKISDYCFQIGREVGFRSSIAGVTYNKKLAKESDIEGSDD